MHAPVELLENDAAEGRILDGVALDEHVVEARLHDAAAARLHVEHDAARLLGRVPTGLKGDAGGVVRDVTPNPIHFSADVVHEAVAHVQVIQRACVFSVDGDPPIIAERSFLVGDLETIDLPILLAFEVHRIGAALVPEPLGHSCPVNEAPAFKQMRSPG